MNDEDWIIAIALEIGINLCDDDLSISEKSSTNRDANSFFLWKLLSLRRLIEKGKIRNDRAWDLESFHDAIALPIAEYDEVSPFEYFGELHLIFRIFQF